MCLVILSADCGRTLLPGGAGGGVGAPYWRLWWGRRASLRNSPPPCFVLYRLALQASLYSTLFWLLVLLGAIAGSIPASVIV